MKIKYCLSACFVLLAFLTHAQIGIEEFLRNVETNNTTLKAIREQTNADKLKNKTGITLQNPELSIAYLWGNPMDIGNQFDYGITQSFDFPTAYFHRSKLADMKNRQVDLAYEEQRREILHEARLAYYNLIYLTKKKEIVENRLEKIENLSEAQTKLFENKSATILQYNKIMLNQLKAEKAKQFLEADIITAIADLARLNGDTLPALALYPYPDYLLPESFETWFDKVKENNVILRSAENAVSISGKQEKLRLAENLPKFTAGYYSEHILGTRLQGFQAGVSVPLWEGKNTIKQQKATTKTLQAQQEDLEMRFKNTTRSYYEKSKRLSLILNQTLEVLETNRNQELLEKSLKLGEYSLIDYLSELIDYYDILEELQDVEYEYSLSVAELQRWE